MKDLNLLKNHSKTNFSRFIQLLYSLSIFIIKNKKCLFIFEVLLTIKFKEMKKFLKKLAYLGVDLSNQTVEKIEESIKDLIEKGDISEKKGKKIVAKLIQKSELKKDYLERKINKVLDKLALKKAKKGLKNLLNENDIKHDLKI